MYVIDIHQFHLSLFHNDFNKNIYSTVGTPVNWRQNHFLAVCKFNQILRSKTLGIGKFAQTNELGAGNKVKDVRIKKAGQRPAFQFTN